MIVYFSGTGNTADVAKRLADLTGDKAYSLYDELPDDEVLGIAYPVYFGGLPTPIVDFVQSYDFAKVKYLYSVATYGGDIGGADHQLRGLLDGRGLDASFGCLTPDNYLPMFNPPTESEATAILEKTYAGLEKVAENIKNRQNNGILSTAKGILSRKAIYHLYKNGRKTNKFYTTDDCTLCGLCESICPTKSIEIKDGVTWMNGQCAFCLGCINRCPTHAIQYGKGTENKRRYVNPIFR